MEGAIAAVHTGQSIRKAAMMYNVPRSTLSDRITGKVDIGSRPGKKPYLMIQEEEEVVLFLKKCASIGYPFTKREAVALVQRVLNGKGLERSVTDGWWARFSERHPSLSLRTAMPLSLARAMATDNEVLGRYYDLLEDTLVKNDLLNDPHRIYNCDETGIPLNPKPLKVIDLKKAKHPSYLTGDTKTQVTVLACTNAAGAVIPPFCIFDRKTLNPLLTKGEVPGTLYGLSGNGWMTRDLFNEWFQRHFLLYAPSTRPLLLLLDGHSSHYCPETIRTAAASQIIIFALPPHTTHLTQPLDKSAFACLKKSWRKVCHEFIVSNPGRVVTRYEFSMLFSHAWCESMTIRNVTSGFTVTGICPFQRKLPELDFEPEKIHKKMELLTFLYIALPQDALPRDTLPRDALPRDALPRDALPQDALVMILFHPVKSHSGTKINTWPSRFVRDAPCQSF